MSAVRRPVLLGLGALAFLVLIALGTWQVQRLRWKTDLIDKVMERTALPPVPVEEALSRFEAGEDIEYLPVRAVGGFPNARIAHVFGTLDGQPGYYAFQAMRLDGARGQTVLVNRGFVPQDQREDHYPLPSADAMVGLVRFYGGASGLAAAFAPAGNPEEGTFYERDLETLARYTLGDAEGRLLPFAIDSTLPTELPRGGTTKLAFRNAHLGYAITWYGLAAGLVVVVALMLRKGG